MKDVLEVARTNLDSYQQTHGTIDITSNSHFQRVLPELIELILASRRRNNGQQNQRQQEDTDEAV